MRMEKSKNETALTHGWRKVSSISLLDNIYVQLCQKGVFEVVT